MFFLPNEYGRKFAMNVSLIAHIIGGSMVIWSTSIQHKSLGFLL